MTYNNLNLTIWLLIIVAKVCFQKFEVVKLHWIISCHTQIGGLKKHEQCELKQFTA